MADSCFLFSPYGTRPLNAAQDYIYHEQYAGGRISDEEQEEWNKSVRVKSLSRAVIDYRRGHCLDPVIPEFIRHVSEPGFEDCIDEAHIFHTLFEDPRAHAMTVAEKIWAEQRPFVLSLAQVAHGLWETIMEKHDTMISTEDVPFRFLDLPGELRNRVYFHMLRPVVCLKDLTGYTSDWFNPAILGTSRQVHYEASSFIYKNQITVLVDPMAMACCIKALRKMPEKSRFRRCRVEVDLSDPRLTMGAPIKTLTPRRSITGVRVKILDFDPERRVAEIINLLVEGLKEMRFLEELRLSCKRTTFVFRKVDHLGFAILVKAPIFPNSTMDCFRALRGLKKVVIEGDLGDDYVASLLEDMNKPSVNLRTAGPLNGIVQKS